MVSTSGEFFSMPIWELCHSEIFESGMVDEIVFSEFIQGYVTLFMILDG